MAGTRKDSAAARPTSLLRTSHFPAYQLYAVASGSKISPDAVLNIAVLETMKWLRERFREQGAPPEFCLPDPADYEKAGEDCLCCFEHDDGYQAQAVWLRDDKIWAFRLTEPDQGTKPLNGEPARAPVPGRVFETDVAYRLFGGRVECGFRTLVSEPEGTQSFCEVYRLGFIKNLARNPLIGLRQGYPIADTPHRLGNGSDIRNFRQWLGDRGTSLPAAVFPEGKARAAADARAFALNISPADLLPPVGGSRVFPPGQVVEPQQQAPVFDISDLARYRMGYAQFFLVPAALADEMKAITGIDLEGAAAVLAEPKRFGGEARVFPARGGPLAMAQTKKDLDALIQNYPKYKEVHFGKVIFLQQAKSIQKANAELLNRSKEEIILANRRQTEELTDFHAEQVRLLNEEAGAKEAKAKRLDAEIQQLKETNARLRLEMEEQAEEFEKQLAEANAQTERLRKVLARPGDKALIPAWAEKEFEGCLMFHKRAKDLLDSAPANSVDLKLLCDALEYLATDYRDFLLGVVDGDGLKLRCSQKYNRPFEVTGNSDTTVTMYPLDYKIKYYIGYKGKPVDSVLDRHLKVGIDNEKLLRVYFLFDENKKLIVVGSLPGHLRTATY